MVDGSTITGPVSPEVLEQQNADIVTEQIKANNEGREMTDLGLAEVISTNAAQGEGMMQIFSSDNVGTILMLAQGTGGKVKVPNAGKMLTIPQGMSAMRFKTMSKMVRDGASKFGDDIVVQGSRAKGTGRASSDIDIGIRVSGKRFNEIIKSRFGTPNPGSAKERTMLHAIKTGKIQRGELGLSKLGKQVENQIKMKIDLSVIRKGGPFDNGPFIPLKK